MSGAQGLPVPSPTRVVALYHAHGRALRAFVRTRVRDAAAVEDVLQEAFLAAMARGLPEDDAGAARWLFAVARNLALKQARDRKETTDVSSGVQGRGVEPPTALRSSSAPPSARSTRSFAR